jgi:rRNA processing protein Gar1
LYIGKLIGQSPQHIIIQSEIGNGFTLETLPALGDDVVDKTNTVIGKVTDIFGPVDRPLFSITPLHSIQMSTFTGSLGEMFYAIKPKTIQKNTTKRKDNKQINKKNRTGDSQTAHTKRAEFKSNKEFNRNLKSNQRS